MSASSPRAGKWLLAGVGFVALLFVALAAIGGMLIAVPVVGRVAGDAQARVQALTGPVTGAATTADAVAPAAQLEAVAPEALADAQAMVAAEEQVLESVYTRVMPSVVHLEVAQQATGMTLPNMPFEIPQVPGFPMPFGGPNTPDADPDGPNADPGGDAVPPNLRRGEGSGFVWDADGHIVTNHHVVADATSVTAIFADGTRARATVLGTDPGADLAVVKVGVPAGTLAPVELGDSGAVKVGQLAVAIGNPFGLDNTMTAGIVSAVGRTIESGTSPFSIPEVIQTDAPINPGNSGGPLLDRLGRVIGINTQIVSRSGSNSGIGFAVPVNIAKRVVPSLIRDGGYTYAWLGIQGQTLLPELATAMGLPEATTGALVLEPTAGGPAAAAGLRGSERAATIDGFEARVGGDVIVAIDGRPVGAMDDLIAYLTAETRPGDVVALDVIRAGGARETVRVTLGERPDEVSLMRGPAQPDGR